MRDERTKSAHIQIGRDIFELTYKVSQKSTKKRTPLCKGETIAISTGKNMPEDIHKDSFAHQQ